MRRAVVAWIALGLFVVLLGMQGRASYNGLVRTQSQASRAWSGVDTLLQQRNALVEPVLRTLEGLSDTQPDLLVGVALARDQLRAAVTREQRITAAQEMDAALSRLVVTVESDSTWSSDPDVQQDQEELARFERRLSIERTTYNEIVTMFNGMLQRFPTNLFANMLGFKQAPLYRESPSAAPASLELPARSSGNRS